MGARPDHACVVYSNLIRRTYKHAAIVLGGIEASLRRLAHYDYWSDSLKRSILLDSGADLVLYGMGEKSIVEVAEALDSGLSIDQVTWICGSAYKAHSLDEVYDYDLLPSFDELRADRLNYARSFAVQYRNMDSVTAPPPGEPYPADNLFVVQNPPQPPLTTPELDGVYELPYARCSTRTTKRRRATYQPSTLTSALLHCGQPRLLWRVQLLCHHLPPERRPAGEPPRASWRKPAPSRQTPTSRATSPTSAAPRQTSAGPRATSRPPAACAATAAACGPRSARTWWSRRTPTPSSCDLRQLPGVKKVFVRSGVRFDYTLADKSDKFLEELVNHHVSGQLRLAPEHVSDTVLAAMGKPPRAVYDAFCRRFEQVTRRAGKEQYVVPYLISSHPGSTMKEAVELAEAVRDMGYMPEQVQDFYPTPSTMSTCMYYTGVDPRNMQPIYVPRDPHEKAMQRALIQYRKPELAPGQRGPAQGRPHRPHRRRECLIRPLPAQGKTSAAAAGLVGSPPRQRRTSRR